MAAGKFQVQLSDALLLVTIPAFGAAMASACGFMRFEPATVYVIALVVALPGALIGVRWLNHFDVDGLYRVALLGVAVTASLVAGLRFSNAFYCRGCVCRNDTAAAAACKAFCEAQEIYHRTDYDGTGVREYAQHLGGVSSLLERVAGSGDPALVDRTFANAEGLPFVAVPKAGYVFKVLTCQGPATPGGRHNYIDDNGNMTGGYALLACPAIYNGTGRESFMISHFGILFVQDLGKDTTSAMNEINGFNPDSSWIAE